MVEHLIRIRDQTSKLVQKQLEETSKLASLIEESRNLNSYKLEKDLSIERLRNKNLLLQRQLSNMNSNL